MLESDRTEQATRERTIKRLETAYDRLKAPSETMYLDKLDGRITGEFYVQRSAEWRRKQEVLLRKIQDIQALSLTRASGRVTVTRSAAISDSQYDHAHVPPLAAITGGSLAWKGYAVSAFCSLAGPSQLRSQLFLKIALSISIPYSHPPVQPSCRPVIAVSRCQLPKNPSPQNA